MLVVNKISLLLLFCISTCLCQLQEGDDCRLKINGAEGTCRRATDCDVDYLMGAEVATVCTIDDIPVLCCPNTPVNLGDSVSVPEHNRTIRPWNYVCRTNDGEMGTAITVEDCPAAQLVESKGGKFPRICQYELCSDLVCCPNIPLRPRLRQDCSYEHAELKYKAKLETNWECLVDGLEGIYTPNDKYSSLCSYYKNYEQDGVPLPRTCDYEFCAEHICCPRTYIANTTCRIMSDYNYDDIEVVAGRCRMDGTGEPGVCRPRDQCVSQPWLGNHTICGRDCDSLLICCPEPDISTMRSSDRVCVNFRELVYSERKVLTKLFPSKLEESRRGVGVKPSGGIIANPKEFPHMAVLGYRTNNSSPTEWLCGGTLISNRFVLTAGHCMSARDLGPVKFVRLGIQDLVIREQHRYNTDCPEEFDVIQRIPHPDYNSSSRYNDIALIKLDRDVKFNPDIYPACLPDSSQIPVRLTAIGFGATGFSKGRTEKLIKVNLDFFTQQECSESFQEPDRKLLKGIVDETQFCAGSRSSIQDTCPGDSGGPIEAKHDAFYRLATVYGITSFGKACGFRGSPAVYTRVYRFVDWIESVVWP